MKRYRYWAVFFLAALIMMVASGCKMDFQYSFAQGRENIESVAIYQYDYDTKEITLIVVLDESDADALLDEIEALDLYRHFLDPPTNYGDVVVYITYLDQTAEVIGLHNCADVDQNGEWSRTGDFFHAKDICTLIMKYVDEDLLPDLSYYFD